MTRGRKRRATGDRTSHGERSEPQSEAMDTLSRAVTDTGTIYLAPEHPRSPEDKMIRISSP